MEAFAKFGSDLDQVTKNVLDRGIRNVEILKQAQYTPMKVEEQVAIIFCGVKSLLQKVPVSSVKNFEANYLLALRERHAEALESIKKGVIDDEITKVLETVCIEIAQQYEK